MKDFECVRAMAEAGNSEAQYQLGLAYNRGMDGVLLSYEESFKWMSKAAEQGHAKANYHLGSLYLHGECCSMRNDIVVCPKDEAKAVACFGKARAAFETAVRDGLFWLAAMYDKGLGVDVDKKKADALLNLAAEFGNDEAKRMLLPDYRSKLRDEKHGVIGLVNEIFKE